jgi:methyl-accepting chemotaxis protein
MNFLEQQRKKVSKVVNQIDEKNEDAVKVMNKMNVHMHGIVSDLNEVDSLVNVIKTKKLAKK